MKGQQIKKLIVPHFGRENNGRLFSNRGIAS